jgi:hypothetical protein
MLIFRKDNLTGSTQITHWLTRFPCRILKLARLHITLRLHQTKSPPPPPWRATSNRGRRPTRPRTRTRSPAAAPPSAAPVSIPTREEQPLEAGFPRQRDSPPPPPLLASGSKPATGKKPSRKKPSFIVINKKTYSRLLFLFVRKTKNLFLLAVLLFHENKLAWLLFLKISRFLAVSAVFSFLTYQFFAYVGIFFFLL